MQIEFLQQKLRMLEQQLQDSEDQYRHFAVDECDMEEENVRAKIMKARSAPHSNARLQRIHEDYKALTKAKQQWTLSLSSNKSRDRKALTRKNVT